jgi:hypothetical protein
VKTRKKIFPKYFCRKKFGKKKSVLEFFLKKHFWGGRIIHPSLRENKEFFSTRGGG